MAVAVRRRWPAIWALALLGVASGCSSSAAPNGAGKAFPAGGEGVLALIGRDTVAPMLLSDGTPVWEVRHSDGSVSVLGALLLSTADAIPGLETVTTWLKPRHEFVGGGAHDGYGRAVGYPSPQVGGHPALPATARDMTRYTARIVAHQVEVDGSHRGLVRQFDVHRPALGPDAFTTDQVISFDAPGGIGAPLRTIDEALAQKVGTMSLVDADIVIVDAGPARLCSGGNRVDHFPFPPCPTSALVLPQVSDPKTKGYVWAITGPLFVRTSGSTFSEVAAYGGADTGAGYLINGPVPAPRP